MQPIVYTADAANVSALIKLQQNDPSAAQLLTEYCAMHKLVRDLWLKWRRQDCRHVSVSLLIAVQHTEV